MRIAVLSDIHSNLVALERVLADCRDADAVWALGDLVGYGPRPNEVLALLRDRGVVAVAGNHDWAVIGRMDTAEFNQDAASAASWTASALTVESRDHLLSLPQVRQEQDHTLAHGSPRDPLWEYVLNASQAAANAEHFSTRVCLIGHTHLPSHFIELRPGEFDASYAEPGTVLDMNAFNGRALLNPGSVGQPRDGDPRSSYLLLDVEAGTVTWKRVEYAIHQTQDQMRDVDLPVRLVQRLAVGY